MVSPKKFKCRKMERLVYRNAIKSKLGNSVYHMLDTELGF